MAEMRKAREETVCGVVEAYGNARLARCAAWRVPGVEAVLEIVTRFCDEIGPSLLDPHTARRVTRGGADGPLPHAMLDARRLVGLLGPCARLFPFQIVAGAGVLDAFEQEVPQLARWLAARGLSSAAEDAAFGEAWRASAADRQRHTSLQKAVEGMAGCYMRRGGEVLVGHFVIERVEDEAIWVRADAGPRGPVRVPPPQGAWFIAGYEVSLAARRAGTGWLPLAASLPAPAEMIDRLTGRNAVSG